jgi:hypothetical protein
MYQGWTFCNESMSSTNGLSARYLTLFQMNVRRYWSAGSAFVSVTEQKRYVEWNYALSLTVFC